MTDYQKRIPQSLVYDRRHLLELEAPGDLVAFIQTFELSIENKSEGETYFDENLKCHVETEHTSGSWEV